MNQYSYSYPIFYTQKYNFHFNIHILLSFNSLISYTLHTVLPGSNRTFRLIYLNVRCWKVGRISYTMQTILLCFEIEIVHPYHIFSLICKLFPLRSKRTFRLIQLPNIDHKTADKFLIL